MFIELDQDQDVLTMDGLLILYASFIVLFFLTFVKLRWSRSLIACFLLAAAIPVIAYHFVPTIKQKIGYMLYDWQQYRNGDGTSYSDSERFTLNKAALEIIQESPISGVGFGDVQDEINSWIVENNSTVGPEKLPHNQFLLYTCSSIKNTQ